MSLLPFFQWCYQSGLGVTIRTSTWAFPVIEAFHLLGFGLTAGAVLVVHSPPARRGAEPTAGRAALCGRQTVADRRRDLDVHIGHPFVPFGIDQVLLQLCLLGEDDVTVPGASLYFHGSAPSDKSGPDFQSTAAGPFDRADIVGSVVWCGLGRALDRVFVGGARTDGRPPRLRCQANSDPLPARSGYRPVPKNANIDARFGQGGSHPVIHCDAKRRPSCTGGGSQV